MVGATGVGVEICRAGVGVTGVSTVELTWTLLEHLFKLKAEAK